MYAAWVHTITLVDRMSMHITKITCRITYNIKMYLKLDLSSNKPDPNPY